MRLLAVIPARGGSKGLPRKNVRNLAGLPLIVYSIRAALAASSVDRLVVSTEDAAIAAVARDNGVEVVDRPIDLAQDETPTRPVIEHVVKVLAGEGYAPDAVLTLQPTSPLRTARHIDEAAALFASDPSADSLVSCVKVPHIFHPQSIMRVGDDGYLRPYLEAPPATRRQEKEPVLARNGAAIYITRTSCLSSFIFGGKLLAYMMTPDESIDIDSEADFVTAELALRGGT